MGMRFPWNRKNEGITRESISLGSYSRLSGGGSYSALENSAFWACVVNLCRTFATLPLHVYIERADGREPNDSSALGTLLAKPCPYLNAYQWRFIMAFNFEITGEAYAIIERSPIGQPLNIYPVATSLITPLWEDGVLYYSYMGNTRFSANDVLRISNLPVGYTETLSPVEYAAKDISVSTNSKKLQDNFFEKGTNIGGVVTVPAKTSTEVKNALGAMFNSVFAGASNSYQTAVLEDNIKYEPIKLEGKDSNFMVDAQKWTIQEVARRFGVPASFIGDMTQATYSNQEQAARNLVTYGLQPRAVAWERGFEKLCRRGQIIRYNFNAMLRGDSNAQASFVTSMVNSGIYSINEARAYLDMPAIPGGDVHYFPLNYTTLDKAGKDPEYEKAEKERKVLTPLEERKQRDREFLSEVKAVGKTSRAKLERQIRKTMKAEIAFLRRLKGKPAESISKEYEEWSREREAEWGQEFIPIFEEMMQKLYPVARKACRTEEEVLEESRKAYADKYAVSMAGRHAHGTVTEVRMKVSQSSPESIDEDIDELVDDWLENKPKVESEEESNRSGNAFNLFLFRGLGINYMHVVASGDACEFCSDLDGKVCEVEGTILDKGSEVKDGEGNLRTIHRNYKHPPFHKGCSCQIAPGR